MTQGGTYEGEWSAGVMSGLGIRTLSSGEVRSGRWGGGRLEAPLDVWQCAYAAEGAADAAVAARRCARWLGLVYLLMYCCLSWFILGVV